MSGPKFGDERRFGEDASERVIVICWSEFRHAEAELRVRVKFVPVWERRVRLDKPRMQKPATQEALSVPTPERIMLPSPVLHRAKQLARLEAVSLSEFVKRAIQAYQPQPASRPRKKNAREERWERMFVRLAKYKAVHGDCNVRHRYAKDPQLADWVRRQRWRKRKGTLRKDRKTRLSELGLAREPREAEWDKRFAELRAFQQEHGHCNVP